MEDINGKEFFSELNAEHQKNYLIPRWLIVTKYISFWLLCVLLFERLNNKVQKMPSVVAVVYQWQIIAKTINHFYVYVF